MEEAVHFDLQSVLDQNIAAIKELMAKGSADTTYSVPLHPGEVVHSLLLPRATVLADVA